MDNEKVIILRMLEENKITVDEASKLLNAVDSNKKEETAIPPRRIYGNVKSDTKKKNDEVKLNTTGFSKDYSDYSKKTGKDDFKSSRSSSGDGAKDENSQNTTDTFNNKFDNFATVVSEKFEQFSKNLEPKLKELSKKLSDETSSLSKSLSKSFSDTKEKADTKVKEREQQGLIEKSFDIEIEGNNNQLNISSLNGDILLHGYNGNNINGKVSYKPVGDNKNIDFIKLGSKYLLSYRDEEFKNVNIDLFIPEKLFSNIIIEGNSGNVDVSTIGCDYFVLSNKNGFTKLNNINSDIMKINCKNSNLSLSNIKSNEGLIENYNNNTNLKNVNVKTLKVDVFNSNVELMMENFKSFPEYMWEVESNNGRINFNLPITNKLGYYINSKTSLSHINISLLNLEYINNEDTFIEARTKNYDDMENHVLLRLETSNAPISIS